MELLKNLTKLVIPPLSELSSIEPKKESNFIQRVPIFRKEHEMLRSLDQNRLNEVLIIENVSQLNLELSNNHLSLE